MEIKEANPDVLLLMEGRTLAIAQNLPGGSTASLIAVGYKFKFHGDDAKVASKELGIAW